MFVFTFSSLILSIFFIIGAYIIFTKQMDMKNKIIVIVLLFILGIVLFMNLDMFKNYNSLIKNISDAKQTIRIPKDSLMKTSGNYSISTWIYIDDWNYKFGEKKTIIKRENSEKKMNPHIYFDPYKNDITIEFYIKDTSSNNVSNNYEEADLWCKNNSQGISAELLKCNYNSTTGDYVASTLGAKCVDNMYNCLDGTIVDIPNNKCESINNEQSSTLKNIPIQKWFNLTYGFGDNHTDIYLNGKLVQTKTFDGVQFIDEFENYDFFICSDGGYSGSIAKTSYYNYLVSPNKAYSIYKEGFNPVVLGSLFSKYNASVTFYEDNYERAKYYIV